jgi:hypothetical protein
MVWPSSILVSDFPCSISVFRLHKASLICAIWLEGYSLTVLSFFSFMLAWIAFNVVAISLNPAPDLLTPLWFFTYFLSVWFYYLTSYAPSQKCLQFPFDVAVLGFLPLKLRFLPDQWLEGSSRDSML